MQMARPKAHVRTFTPFTSPPPSLLGFFRMSHLRLSLALCPHVRRVLLGGFAACGTETTANGYLSVFTCLLLDDNFNVTLKKDCNSKPGCS